MKRLGFVALLVLATTWKTSPEILTSTIFFSQFFILCGDIVLGWNELIRWVWGNE